MMKSLKIFWQFSRPHTIIGSLCSISSLYVLASKGHLLFAHLWLFAATLLAALACNVFIVGINQIADIELDKINKPYLPLAAGSLTMLAAKQIVWACLFISLLVSILTSYLLFLLILVILLIGAAYSLPPLSLKKHHLPAALAITVVRGLLVNVGIFLHFQYAIDQQLQLPDYIVCLTVFMMAFSIAIAWFKDLPDTDGDQQFRIKTLAVLYSKKNALYGGMVLLSIAYAYLLYWSFIADYAHTRFLFLGNSVLFVFFLLNYFSVRLNNQVSVKYFYLRFWVFFFVEYWLFAIWILL